MKKVEQLEIVQMVTVASFAEAWIENKPFDEYVKFIVSSPPSRRRGLKTQINITSAIFLRVASFAEAWIENKIDDSYEIVIGSRLLRGGVD